MKEIYTLRKIIEDNAKNLTALGLDLTKVLQEADYLEEELPSSISVKTKVRIAISLLQVAVYYK